VQLSKLAKSEMEEYAAALGIEGDLAAAKKSALTKQLKEQVCALEDWFVDLTKKERMQQRVQ
jgi:hypothetical protein